MTEPNVVPLDVVLGADLFDDVYSFLGRFIAYPSHHAQVAHVLWIAHTHLMDVWDATPRLAFLSPNRHPERPGHSRYRSF